MKENELSDHHFFQAHQAGHFLILERVKHGSPLTAKPSDIKLHHPIIRRKSSESIVSNPGTPEKRITRNKTLVNRNLSHEALVTHPAISILKEPARARTNSLPGAFPLKTQVQSPKNLPLRMLKEYVAVFPTFKYMRASSVERSFGKHKDDENY